MRRFFIGLAVGAGAGWLVAWWQMGRTTGGGAAEMGQESTRIALPDLPWGDEEEEVPETVPVETEAAEVEQEVAEDVLAHARRAIEGPEPLLAYCARCRTKRPVQDPEPTATKDGRPAVRGTCPECGAKMFRFVSY